MEIKLEFTLRNITHTDIKFTQYLSFKYRTNFQQETLICVKHIENSHHILHLFINNGDKTNHSTKLLQPNKTVNKEIAFNIVYL